MRKCRMPYQSKRWIGTLFIEGQCTGLPEGLQKPGVTMSMGQLERCPKTGKEHLQFYVELLKKSTISGTKKLIDMPTAHLESARGSSLQCIEYCSKEDTRIGGPWEYKQKMTESPSTLKEWDVLDSLQKMTVRELLMEKPTLWRNIQALTKVKEIMRKQISRTQMPNVVWLWGDAGTGKSMIAYKIAEYVGDYYVKCKEEQYWNGYEQQKLIIVDDIGEGDMTGSSYKSLCDRYAYKVKRKLESPVDINSDWIIFTSNYSPTEVFKKDDHRAITRRIKILKYFREGLSRNILTSPSGAKRWGEEVME